MNKVVIHALRFLALLAMVSPFFAVGLLWPWMNTLVPVLLFSHIAVIIGWGIGTLIICDNYGGDTRACALNWLLLFIMSGYAAMELFSTAICLHHGPASGTILLGYLTCAFLVLATWMWQRLRPVR